MDVVFAGAAFEHSGNQVVFDIKSSFANWAAAGQVAFHTAETAADIHQAVGASGNRRKSHRSNKFAFDKLHRTDGADLWVSGRASVALSLFA
jgi:hypothetical protein